MNSTIEKKMNHCVVCGKPSGTWTKCTNCRAKIYAERSRKKREVKGITPQDDEKFYQQIWKHSLHYCSNCGKELREFNFDLFHHILDKKNYPEYRYNDKNIILLCGKFGCHGLVESAISYPKTKVFEYCEMIKRLLLAESGITYESKITIP